MRPIYEYLSYKTYLKDQLKNKGEGVSVTSLAQAAACNRTYLSQVLNSKVQITPDQAVLMAEYLKLNSDEKDFFLLLVLLERASNFKSRSIFEKKIQFLVSKNQKLEN